MLGTNKSLSLTGGAAEVILPGGRYLRVLSANEALTLNFYDESGQPIGEFTGVLGGFAVDAQTFREVMNRTTVIFGKVGVSSATTQTVTIAIARVPIDYDRLTGTITTTQASGATATQSSVTVSSTSAALLAANANRRVAHIKNTSATETVYVCDDGTTATASHFPIGPGETLRFESQDGLNAIRGGSVDAVVRILEERD